MVNSYASMIDVAGMQQFDLVGYGDLDATRLILANERVEPLPFVTESGKAPQAKFVFSTDHSSQGSLKFSESYLAVFVHEKGGDSDANGLFFFQNVNTSTPSVFVARHLWRSPHVVGDIDLAIDLGATSQVDIYLNHSKIGHVQRGASTLPTSSHLASYSMKAYSPRKINPFGLMYSFSIEGNVQTRKFDSATDAFWVDSHSVWGQVMQKVGFVPDNFEVFENMRYRMELPTFGEF